MDIDKSPCRRKYLQWHMSSSVLFRSDDETVVLLDLPRSIEESQSGEEPAVLVAVEQSSRAPSPPPPPPALSKSHTDRRRLVSTEPPRTPFSLPEPKRARHDALPSVAAQVAQLMTRCAVERALGQLQAGHAGPWLLPRALQPSGRGVGPDGEAEGCDPGSSRKRKAAALSPATVSGPGQEQGEQKETGADTEAEAEAEEGEEYFFPPASRYILGSIEATRQAFVDSAPAFDLIVLDPPWPNRSAARKKGRGRYNLAAGTAEIRRLLSLIPVTAHLAPDGLVAVWVTNKPAFTEVLTSLLDEWGLELVGEWAWLKVTSQGEPVFPVESEFRKPWEPLLVARRKGSSRTLPAGWDRRVLVAVPDVHSRKPNLRRLFQGVLQPGFCGLEVFARSLVAGWWSWGDDVLRFQHRSHWALDE
ncbi:hypothetical protein RB595_001726 [Gaeumannomyces hyphopodioides]